MDRGYYYALDARGARCPHRHYELSLALRQCHAAFAASGAAATIWYEDAAGKRRPIRRDEAAELEARTSST